MKNRLAILTETEAHELAALDNAFLQLAEATTIDDVQSIQAAAEVARILAKKAKLGLEIQNKAAELKIRAERKAGEFLGGLKLHGGSRVSSGHDGHLKLKDIGITHHQSKRWQKEAMVPEDQFERYIQEARDNGVEISSAAVMRLADRHCEKNGDSKSTRRKGKPKMKMNSLILLSEQQSTEARQLLEDIAGHSSTLANLAHEKNQDDVVLRANQQYAAELQMVVERLQKLLS